MTRRILLMKRLWRNARWAAVIIFIALVLGMVGYVYFGDGVTWPQAFADASMILAGEGPLDQLKSSSGQIFEGAYALICGFLFFAIAGFALAPALHHILRSFHLEDEEHAARAKK